jgi:hypothetical protein
MEIHIYNLIHRSCFWNNIHQVLSMSKKNGKKNNSKVFAFGSKQNEWYL